MERGVEAGERRPLSLPVLVLNQNFEPLAVCNTKRAVVLVFLGKAQVIEDGRGWIHTATTVFPRPSVIRLNRIIRRPRPKVKLLRKEIFRRDGYTCQYCGRRTRQLTIDHVIPRHKGGEHAWGNLASACRACNRKKGGKTPQEARMTLLHTPREPKATPWYLFSAHVQRYQDWRKFLQGWGGAG
jgi:5-methylcytosine-specific restriction endonuclease McrA